MIDQEFSIKVRNLSLLAIVCVVLIHSNSIFATGEPVSVAARLADWFFYRLSAWAVPFFFMMSGFWFALKPTDFGTVMRKKFKTLLVPYVVFLVRSAVALLPVAYLQARSHGASLWSYSAFRLDFLSIGLLLPAGNGPLWYVRSLLILFLFAPVWRLLYDRLPIVLLALGVLGLVQPAIVLDGWVPFRLGQSSFFFLGMFLCKYQLLQKSCQQFPYKRVLFGVLFGLTCLSLFLTRGLQVSGPVPYVLVAFVWIGFDFLLPLSSPLACGQFVFWIYCTHMIVLEYLLPIARLLPFPNDWCRLAATGVVAAITFFVTIGLAVACRKVLPRTYQLVCGGR